MTDTNETYVSAWRVWKKAHRLGVIRRKGNREQVLDQQQRNLDRLLQFAVKRCPFYAAQARGIDPGKVKLSDFTPTDKNEIMANFEQVVTDPMIRLGELQDFVSDPGRVGELFMGRYVAAHTSGSSGVRGIFIIDKWGWEMSQAMGLSAGELPRFGWGWPRALAAPLLHVPAVAVVPKQGHYSSILVPTIKSPFADRFVDLHLLEITDPFEKLVDEINRIKPFGIYSYPSMLDVLAHYRQRGLLQVKLHFITAAGEPFTPDIRRHVQQAWPGAGLVDMYASTEVMSIAKQCSRGTYHLNEDWLVVENVDEAGKPVPAGRRGEKIYVTHLYNYLMPLIRYEMSDSIEIEDEPCPCGSPFAGVKVLGRTNHTLTLPGRGKDVMILPTPLLVAFMDVPGLRQYQVIQESRDMVHVNFVSDEGWESEPVRKGIDELLDRYFKKHGVASPIRRSYKAVEEIPRDPYTHKIMQIVNKTMS